MPAPSIPAPSRSAARHPVLSLFLATLGGTLPFVSTQAASPPPALGRHGMVASAEAHATRAGLEVLRRGGNAVDASIAVAFALAVTFPEAGNLGGGGFLLVRSGGRVQALDFREIAPRALKPELFLDEEGRPVPDRSLRGGLAVGVPGSVAGLVEAHRLWGSRPWRELLAPAIRLASRGFLLSRAQAESLADRSKALSMDPAARAIFTRDGAPLEEGDLLVQRDLAATLRRIASRGSRGFYQDSVARAVVDTVRHAGGVMEEADLASYRAVLREPVEGVYRGHRVVTFPPPSSGGVVLLEILGILEKFDLKASGSGSSLTIHRMAEAEKRAFADRSRWLGDPDFFKVPLRGLLEPAYLASRAASIRDDRATASAEVLPGSPPGTEPADTTHFSVAGPDGDVVSVTTTLNSSFGAAMVAAGTGVLLNNEMDDFALAPGMPNQFGVTGGEANAIAGGKRPLSSMCPTIVEPPRSGLRPLLVLGSPGGPAIITSVLQVLLNVVDHGMGLQEAVDAPRFHHQWLPDRIDHEVQAFPDDVARALVARGHELHPRGHLGHVCAIGVGGDGAWTGAVDPRRGGLAAGF